MGRALPHADEAEPEAGEPDPAQERELVAGLGHIAAIAAVTAIRADDKAEVTIPVTSGAVHLPTLGRLVVAAGEPGHEPQQALFITNGNTASIRIGEDCWEITHADLLSGEPSSVVSPGGDGAVGWQPVRRLTAPGFSVALEDTDPYRDCHRWPPSARLTDMEMAHWQRCFAEGWQKIKRDFPGLCARHQSRPDGAHAHVPGRAGPGCQRGRPERVRSHRYGSARRSGDPGAAPGP